MRARIAGAAFGLVAGLTLVVGCGGDGMAEVSGTVTVDGKAVDGAITFLPADGKSQTAGGAIQGGRYTARVPLGTAKVEIRVPKEVGRKKLYNTPDSPEQPILQEVLPERYNNKTELTYDVKAGRQEKNWELPSK
jgi:hypothetical protein